MSDVRRMTIWATTRRPSTRTYSTRSSANTPAPELVDEERVANKFIPTVQKARRGDHRRPPRLEREFRRSAAIDHVHDWVNGTPDDDGSRWPLLGWLLRRRRGPHLELPCTCSDGEWKIVEGLEVNDFSRERIDASVGELREERDAVRELGLISLPRALPRSEVG